MDLPAEYFSMGSYFGEEGALEPVRSRVLQEAIDCCIVYYIVSQWKPCDV